MTPRSDPDWRPCSDCALARGDNLEGTGSRGLQWFLVELSGSWGHSAFMNSPAILEPSLGRDIARRIERAGMRPLAIRRTGRRAEPGVWRWAFVDSRPGHETIRWGRVDDPHELLEVPLDGSTGIESPDPIVVVCTHGRHDQCCAVHGRRAALALDRTHPDQMWECSHLGGDRFAATMVMFPHGFYFGRADLTDTSALFEQYTQGTVDTRFVRGRSSLSNTVQAAQHHARLLLHDNRIDTLHPRSEIVDGDIATVALAHDSGTDVTVTLELGWSTPILTTCDATIPGPVRTYTMRGIELTRPPELSDSDRSAEP